jgi:predicted permease
MEPLYFTLFNTNILAALTIMYVYWFLGGKNSIQYFFPSNSSLRRSKVKPKKWKLFITAIVLAAMTWLNIEQIQYFIFDPVRHQEVFLWGNRCISIIFLLRAFGNFTYIGFTKTFTDSTYAKLDTYVYSPACVLVAVSAYMIDFLN